MQVIFKRVWKNFNLTIAERRTYSCWDIQYFNLAIFFNRITLIIIAGATEDNMEVAAIPEYSTAGINLRKQKPIPKELMKAYKKIMSDQTYRQKAKKLKEHHAKFYTPELCVSMVEKLFEKRLKPNLILSLQ